MLQIASEKWGFNSLRSRLKKGLHSYEYTRGGYIKGLFDGWRDFMKKVFLLFAFIIVISLSSCSSVGEGAGMTIRPCKFSKETQKVLNIIDDEIVFFDYDLDETVKFFSINLWFYKNGEWVADGKISNSINSLKNRIAIQLKESEVDVFSIDEMGGFTKYGLLEPGMDFSNSTFVASNRISEPTQIVLNEEIPLWVKVGTDKDSIQTGAFSSSDFRNFDCNAGIAVTVTFYDEKIEQ